MNDPKKKRGKAASDSTLKLRDWLHKLPGEAFDKSDYLTYRKATNDVKTSRAIFQIEKRKEAKGRGFAVKTRGPRAQAAAALSAPAPSAARHIQILASLPLSNYPNLDPAAVKALAGDIVKQFNPAGQVMVLSDPPAIEIRVPA